MAEPDVELLGRLQKAAQVCQIEHLDLACLGRTLLGPQRGTQRRRQGLRRHGGCNPGPFRSPSKRLRLLGFIVGSARRQAPRLAAVSFASVMSASRTSDNTCRHNSPLSVSAVLAATADACGTVSGEGLPERGVGAGADVFLAVSDRRLLGRGPSKRRLRGGGIAQRIRRASDVIRTT